MRDEKWTPRNWSCKYVSEKGSRSWEFSAASCQPIEVIEIISMILRRHNLVTGCVGHDAARSAADCRKIYVLFTFLLSLRI